jgi:hypothetical protein
MKSKSESFYVLIRGRKTAMLTNQDMATKWIDYPGQWSFVRQYD